MQITCCNYHISNTCNNSFKPQVLRLSLNVCCKIQCFVFAGDLVTVEENNLEIENV